MEPYRVEQSGDGWQVVRRDTPLATYAYQSSAEEVAEALNDHSHEEA